MRRVDIGLVDILAGGEISSITCSSVLLYSLQQGPAGVVSSTILKKILQLLVQIIKENLI